MTTRKVVLGIVVAVGLACLSKNALAEVTFEWVLVGDAGNVADALNAGSIPGIGSVSYDFRIAKFEVTNDQYAEFLNAVATDDPNGLYNAAMGSDVRGGITQSGSSGSFSYSVKTNMGSKPVNFVSYLDAMRFVNWLENGQPVGLQGSSTTEDGTYTISDGLAEVRAIDAQHFIPSENEWYKAAYYQPAGDGGDSDHYWLFPTSSNTAPTFATADPVGNVANPGANVANYDLGAVWNGQNGNVTTVGSAGLLSESYYGSSDQGGNVDEWNEDVSGASRVIRGGSWLTGAGALQSSDQFTLYDPMIEGFNIGFRIASQLPDPNNIPTISSLGLGVMILLFLGAGGALLRRRVLT